MRLASCSTLVQATGSGPAATAVTASSWLTAPASVAREAKKAAARWRKGMCGETVESMDRLGFNAPGREMDDITKLRRILRDAKTLAVVGLSANWYRPSYFAAKYMQEHGYRVIPVNPQYDSVLGEKCYASVRDIPGKVDIVDCFRKSAEIPALAEDAIAIGAKVLWMQLGVENEAARRRAETAGLEVVENRCVKIEHARLFGGL